MNTHAAKLKTAATYNAAADHFDDVPLGFWGRIGRRTVEGLELHPGSKVLDVGCGTGASALPAAEEVGPQGEVIGVDLAERLLEIARGKARDRGLTNMRFVQGDMGRLDWPDASFDAVVSVFSIFFVDDMVSVLRELWRMVRPRGTLAVTTWGPQMFEPGTSIWWNAVKEVRPDLIPEVSPWERITKLQAVRHLFKEARIEDVEVVAENGRQELRSPDDWWTIVLGSGFRWTVEQLGPDGAERVRHNNLDQIRLRKIESVETNAIFARARKRE